MNTLNRTNFIEKLTSVVVIVGAASLLSLSGCSQPNAGTNSSNQGSNSGDSAQVDPSITNSPDASAPTQGAGASSGTSAPTQGGTNSSTAISASDQQFITQVAQDSMAEVQLGQLAVQRASSDSVKQFAQRMIQDHTQANQQMAQLASAKGVTLPQDIGDRNQAVMARLKTLSGAEFDRAYMTEMVNAHTTDVSLLQRQTQKGQDQDLKNWSAKKLPALQEHLQMARSMAQQTNQ